MDGDRLDAALRYLHAVDDIVLFSDGYVCTKPQEISKRFANFVCPDGVMNKLPHTDPKAFVSVLDENEIGKLIATSGHDSRCVTFFGSFALYQYSFSGENPIFGKLSRTIYS